ncbi:hypothetical protein IFM89_012902 [Coptis chinensis]|uniref:mannosyl-glycoprotein endo-beta-N-acetylglucosaminidase n=1 Tax=Coptis chinensis TaxID=261450 RepID=A0A835HEK7_9MAGN|nr:hypothetical protein IFM89_012902 [Coptis chinensis]
MKSLLQYYIKRQTLISIKNYIHSILSPIMSTSSPSSSQNEYVPPFDPLKPSLPISYPLKTLEDIETRSYFKSFHFPFNISTVPPSSTSLPLRPRCLVCHDMEGGYVDDKWIQGGSNESAYAIWHWYLIDIFVYFSHNLVTIPPTCWTNAAHTHGVKMNMMVQFFRFIASIALLVGNLFRKMQNCLWFSKAKDSSSQENESFLAIDPPPFDPLKPSTPISYPLQKLEDLESRSYFKSFHYPFNVASVPLPSSSSSLPSRPRNLVCHDMAGGYVDDKWVQGGTNEGAYAIWHWYLIDIFVYFSHNLVTVPPPCWTNAAHTHGVKVLGTFITEWDEGRAICNTLLSTKESAQKYAELLAELAVALGFDGWLINMEVELDVVQIPNLKEFVNHLTQTMHSSLPGSLVIWYDSVTIDGNLSWQNQLNDLNKPFFDLCDGIFVNYTWQEDYPKTSATAAGNRKFDVYMGIDVFGRNTYGGGQWTTNVALDVLKKDEVSAAIFAPGWVYETKQPPDFQTAQNRWWGLVEKSWGLLRYYPLVLPFYSNFDQGHGYHFSVGGEQVSNESWCNISCQSFQPVLDYSVESSPNTIQFMVDFNDASFSGGGNITFKGTLQDNAYFSTRLFKGELPLEDTPIHIMHSVKSDGSSLVGLSLEFSSELNKKVSVLLAYDSMNQVASKFDKVVTPYRVTKLASEVQAAPEWIIQETSITMNGFMLTGIHAVCYKSKAKLEKLRVEQARGPGGRKLIQAGSTEFFASLGHITIKTSNQSSDFPPSTLWVVEGHNISWASGPKGTKTLSIKIVWSLKGDSSLFPMYNIYVEKQAKGTRSAANAEVQEYIGVARVRAFYISEYLVPPGTSSLKFVIQVCGVDGACQVLDSCPTLVLDVEAQ